jgi:serine/threonine protein kinase
MLHEMLTGQHPNDHSMVSTSAQVTPLEIVSRTPTHTPGVPSSLAHILNQMLSVDPRDRYASAQQLHHILLRYKRQRRGSGPNSMPTNGQAVVREQDRGRDPPSARTEDTEVVGVTYSDIADQEQGTDWPFLILSLLVVLAILGLILLWTAIRRQYIFPRG